MQEVSRSGFELSIPSFRGFKLFNIFSRGYQTEMNHIHRSYSTDLHDANVHATWSTIPRLVMLLKCGTFQT